MRARSCSLVIVLAAALVRQAQTAAAQLDGGAPPPAPPPAPGVVQTPHEDLVIKIRLVDSVTQYRSIFDDTNPDGEGVKKDEEVAAGLLVVLAFAVFAVGVVGAAVMNWPREV